MKRPLRFTLIWAGALAALAVLAPFAAAGTQTYYVSPTGSGTSCEQSSPCEVTYAAGDAANEDTIIVGPGTYTLPPSGLSITKAIAIGGQAGSAAPVFVTSSAGNLHVNVGTNPYLHDLRIEGSGGLILGSGIGERLFVSYTGSSASGCSLSSGVTLLDSVCWAHDGGSASSAISTNVSGAATITLRNVTAVTAAGSATAIYAKASSGNSLTLNATNVIARGSNHPDVEAIPSAGASVAVNLSHSNYETASQDLPAGTVTDPGTNGNQTGAPLFVNAGAGDFHQAIGSPTIEAGLNETANGTIALAGEARVLGTCVGGPGITDIGAYEFVPTAACPSTAIPIAAATILNKFKVEKVKLNKKKGTGTLLVTVPGPGKFTLSGKGVKKASRSSHGSEVLKLAVKPVGKAKKKLAKTGGAKLSLKLKFVPNGGTAAQQTKKVTLLEKVS
jgi:hypothetical protein